MEGSEEQKVCPNCKREIPAVNFTIHTVHCARNIKVCPVCKEPVPSAELTEHHDKLHKLLPCKKCGEKVCGTDLEDHIRDSCGHTVKSCRYCSLELARRELPAHESYCGVRTEQCAACGEWVMIKYKALHEDSNHGFLRLDDDPIPVPRNEPKLTNITKLTNLPKPMNIAQSSTSSVANVKNTNLISNRPRTEIRFFNPPSTSNDASNAPSGVTSATSGPKSNGVTSFNLPSSSKHNGITPDIIPSGSRNGVNQDVGPSGSRSNGVNQDSLPGASRAGVQNVYNGVTKIPQKRTNDQPQINTSVTTVNKVEKNLGMSRGAVKKRPAPPPPADPKRELAYSRALQRHQDEERARQQQSAYNVAHGLPPVLSSAAKLEKLRKMDALHNREVEDTDYKNRLQGRVWMDTTFVPIGNTLGSGSQVNNGHLETDRRRESRPEPRPAEGARADNEDRRSDFRDVKPMTPEQFMDRFKELQLRKDRDERNERKGDRFSEIKSSLRELRRGLNEVTAPYNSNSSNSANGGRAWRSPCKSPSLAAGAAAGEGAAGGGEEDVQLPCEFCGTPVRADDLVLHQTGCRPELTQYRAAHSPTPPSDRLEPVIPCEFCTQCLPVYLISEHQERCGREANLLYPD